MSSPIRKRSPRAPLINIMEALDRATKVYEAEGRHAAAAEIVAQHLGYKSADNGAAKQQLAALGYYGLLERPSEGMLAVSKSVEEYKFAPSNEFRMEILRKWLHTPALFAELLDKFQDKLPSEASLKFELIQRGFNPATADECLAAFVQSVNYVKGQEIATVDVASNRHDSPTTGNQTLPSILEVSNQPSAGEEHRTTGTTTGNTVTTDEESDRIPVRLTGGRRAWLVIPSPFYANDKRRLISQIELLITDDEDEH